MSILAMTVCKVATPDRQRTLNYNTTLWSGNINLSNFEFNTFIEMNRYLKSKYKKIHYFRIKMGKTFGGKIFKPREIYADDMDNESEPNCIMVEENGSLKLVVVKAKRAKEIDVFGSAAKNTYVPVFVYKTETNNISLINFK